VRSSIKEKIQLIWQGPFCWPKFDSASAASFDLVPDDAYGIYLWTVEYRDGFLIYTAGITRDSFKNRFRNHTWNYLNGVYTLFNLVDLQQGIRTELWHGFWMRKRSTKKQKEYKSRREEIVEAARKQLSVFRIFVARIDRTPRILERLEASIMNALYTSAGPVSEIPDRGMRLAPRWQSERPVIVRNIVPVKLHGLPEYLTI
jgi:hypothetical protein